MSGINSRRNLQILYFSEKNKKLKKLTNAKKKWPRITVYTYYSCFIDKLSLRSNLNLLQSVAKMLKSSKFMVQLHCIRWSEIAYCFTFLRHFPVRLEIAMRSAALV